MYEIDVAGDVTTVSAALLADAWSESSPRAVAEAIALPVECTAVVCAHPQVVVRRVR